MNKPNIKDTLFGYVTDTKHWFYWYHNLERLEGLHKRDHDNEKDKPYYQADKFNFIKRPWRFKGKTVTNKEGKNVVIEESLADFFEAVLDEVRLKKANDFAEYALYISDNEDLAYFRNMMAKRELVADIDYAKQRDHAVHTLYNYLLGWYIFEHSKELQKKFKDQFIEHVSKFNNGASKKTDLHKNFVLRKSYEVEFSKFRNKTEHPDENITELIHEFADVWTIVSLLHDVGYILEGSLSSASPDDEHDRITNGSKIIHNYFNYYFWKSFEVDFRVGKNIAKTLGVVVPDFRYSESLASIGDRLCDIGTCENIRQELQQFDKFRDLVNDREKYRVISEEYGLNREAFSIWKEYYRFYKKEKMENILSVVERVYKNMMWVGADYGSRSLDHGICSGLIILQALTFFRELFWGFRKTDWERKEDDKSSKKDDEFFDGKQKKQKKLGNIYDLVSNKLYEQIRKEINHVPMRIRIIRNECVHDKKCCDLHPDFWFNKILWATSASAVHSIIQKPGYKKQCQKHLNIEPDELQDSIVEPEEIKKREALEEHRDSHQKSLEGRQESLDKNFENLKIGLDEDPLAFLGVFVDVLQEWDRYTVTGRGEAAFSDVAPLQSAEVYLYKDKSELDRSWLKTLYIKEKKEKDKGKSKDKYRDYEENLIYLAYPAGDNEKKDWIKELKKTMGYGLNDDWKKIVEIVAYNPKTYKEVGS